MLEIENNFKKNFVGWQKFTKNNMKVLLGLLKKKMEKYQDWLRLSP